jgi:hypothetical protein
MEAIPDFTCEQIKSLVNSTIHELVFLAHHAEDDQKDEAQNCLNAIGLNVGQLEELLK